MKGSEHRSTGGFMRRLLTASVVLTVIVALIGVAPARALRSGSAFAATTTTTPGMDTIVNGQIIKPAPANFKQQLISYINSFSAASKQYPDLTNNVNMPVATSSALQLVTAATAPDLNALYYMFQRMPQWQQTSHYFKQIGRAYTQAVRWSKAQEHPNLLLKPALYDDACAIQITTATVRAILTTADDLASAVYELFPDSFTVEVLGVAHTFEASPIKAIVGFVRIATWALSFAAETAADIRKDCTDDAHQQQFDKYVTYNQDHIANEQLNVNVTPLDAYHYLVAVHQNGLPINITTTGLQLQTTIGAASSNGQVSKPLIVDGNPYLANGTTPAGLANQCNTPGTSGAITQVSFCPVQNTDPGLYELIIPTSLIGTSYRITVDDGFTCPTNPDPGWPAISNCDHYGVQVFTKATNS